MLETQEHLLYLKIFKIQSSFTTIGTSKSSCKLCNKTFVKKKITSRRSGHYWCRKVFNARLRLEPVTTAFEAAQKLYDYQVLLFKI